MNKQEMLEVENNIYAYPDLLNNQDSDQFKFIHECIQCRVASFEPESRVIEYYNNVREANRQINFIDRITAISKREREGTNKYFRVPIRVACKRKHIEVDRQEAVEIRCI